MAESCQGQRTAFTCKDRIQDLEATYSSDVVQDAMNLEIHLIEGFLHMQDMLTCHLDEAAAMSPEDSEQTPNRDRREPTNVITCLYATPDPRLSVGLPTGHQCRRGL